MSNVLLGVQSSDQNWQIIGPVDQNCDGSLKVHSFLRPCIHIPQDKNKMKLIYNIKYTQDYLSCSS